MFCAGTDGKIYSVTGGTGAGSVACGKKTVQSIMIFGEKRGDTLYEGLIASSTDKSLHMYTIEGTKLTPHREFKLSAPAIAMDMHGNSLALGLKNGNIEILPIDDSNMPAKNVMNTHNEGEVWGLASVTLADGSRRVVTSGDDNRIIAYNVD